MSHLTSLELSMHADDALSAEQAEIVAGHLASCATCQAHLKANYQEVGLISSALLVEDVEQPDVSALPVFKQPASLRGFAMANLATGLVIWLAQFLWKTLFGELVVNATTWATSIYLPDAYAMASAAALYLLEEGTTMFDTYLIYIVVSVSAATLVWLTLRNRRAGTAMSLCLLMLMIGTTVMPVDATALEVRRDQDVITIASTETIDDTVLLGAETVLIEGVITGDVVAVGRRIKVSGTIEGNLVTFAESVTISGSVGGFALGAASKYDLRDATVAGDLWVAGETIGVDDESRVGRNATFTSRSTSIEGNVGQDLYTFGETVEFSGDVGENLEVFASNLRLLGDARIGGNVRFRNPEAKGGEEKLHRAPGVVVEGEVELLGMPEGFEKTSRYATVQFYLWQVARLIGAFLVGLGLFWLIPSLRNLSIGAGAQAFKTAGIGLLIAVGAPMVALVVAFTLVGLPLSFMGFAAWLLGLYLAKIVVGMIIGRMLLGDSESVAKPLFAGLFVVFVVINLPYIGGIIGVFLTIVGLGLLIQYLLEAVQDRDSDAMAS